MATKKMEPADVVPGYVQPETAYVSHDRKGVWFRSNASFPIEDPTGAGKGHPLPRIQSQGFAQVTETDFIKGQHAAGVLTKFSGDPRDEGSQEVPFAAAKPAAAPVQGQQGQGGQR